MNSNEHQSNSSQQTKKFKHQPCSGVFRSEEMLLCQLFLRSNVSFETTCRLGELGKFCFHILITFIMIFFSISKIFFFFSD
mgnify:FL=1